METKLNSLNKVLPVAKKFKKYLPLFIGFKLITFTGFLTYIMNRQMISSLQRIKLNFSLLELIKFSIFRLTLIYIKIEVIKIK